MAFRHKITKKPYISVKHVDGSRFVTVTTATSPYGYAVRKDMLEEYKDGKMPNFTQQYPVPEPQNDGTSFKREKWVTITTTSKRWLEQMIKEREERLPLIPNADARQMEADYVGALKARLEELNGTA